MGSGTTYGTYLFLQYLYNHARRACKLGLQNYYTVSTGSRAFRELGLLGPEDFRR